MSVELKIWPIPTLDIVLEHATRPGVGAHSPVIGDEELLYKRYNAVRILSWIQIPDIDRVAISRQHWRAFYHTHLSERYLFYAVSGSWFSERV